MSKQNEGPEKSEVDRRVNTTNLYWMVLRSFERMGPKGRRRMRIGGIFFMMVGAVPPAIAGAFERQLAVGYLIFEGTIFAAGLLLFRPEVGILFIRLVPSAVMRIMPSKVLNLLDRRDSSSSPEDDK